MIRLAIYFLMIFPTCLFAQDTKKINDKVNHEVYYVLKSNDSIRQGNYQKYNYKGKMVTNGYYQNGLKDSTWTEYDWNGKNVQSKGNYSNGMRSGIWEFYDSDQQLIQKYDFTKKELIFYLPAENEKDKKFRVISGGDTIESTVDRPPLYIGGRVTMTEVLSKNARYPAEARENHIMGTVKVAFIIDKDGSTSDYHVVKSVGSGCDEEAVRVIKLLEDNWIAALLNGQPVSVEYVLPFTFKLSTD